MKFSLQYLAIAILMSFSSQVACAGEIKPAELKNLQRICSDLLDKPFLSPHWDKLRPYLRDKHALDSVKVVCSGSSSGSVALRGELWLNFIYVNPQKMGERWGPKDGLIYSVTLSDNKKDVFHRETEPKG